MSYSQTRSSNGGCNVAVYDVEVSAPKCGNVLDTPVVRAGTMDRKWTARVSPGSASSMKNGPVTGFRYGNVQTWLGRSSTVVTAPPKQSSVNSVSTSPERRLATGSTPPNV